MSKNLRLSVPSPCHENWEQMTPAEKGRFCDSCQKEVIDFTSMSDAQIIAYFKKGVTSGCGRFHNDQLHREITVPKKRMPWIKYFFSVAIPAFLFSCRDQGYTLGIMDADKKKNRSEVKDNGMVVTYLTTGVMIPEIIPDTSSFYPTPPPPPDAHDVIVEEINCDCTTGVMMVEPVEAVAADIVYQPIPTDTVLTADDQNTDTLLKDAIDVEIVEIDTTLFVPLDEVSVTAPLGIRRSSMTLGGFVTGVQVIEEAEKEESDAAGLLLYPNPVVAGSVLKVDWRHKTGNYNWEIHDMGGRMISSGRIFIQNKSGHVEIPVPYSTPGMYVLSFKGKKGRVYSDKFIIK